MNICNAASYTTLVQELPTVSYVTTPGAQAEVGKSLNFTVSGTKDTESINAQLTYEWNFGDGSGVQTTSSSSLSHTYTTNGNYTVSVRAFDGGYYSSTQYHALSIVGPTTPNLGAEAVSCSNNIWAIAVDWSPTNSYPVGHYDVEVSDNFGSWMLIYSGTAQYTEYDAFKNTTQRFRAKACSATDGCSALTTIRTVNLPNHCNMD